MDFDPYTQNVSFLAANGITPVNIPIPIIDQWNDETVSIVLNYGSQLGACIIMLLVLLIMTPSSKFLHASNVLYVLGLVVCITRSVFLAIFFLTPFSHFYQVWANDFSQIPQWNFDDSLVGTAFPLILVVVTEAALMNQAWTMVSLWPGPVKCVISVASALIALAAVSFRLAYTVVQCRSILNTTSSVPFAWIGHATLISNTLSIAWFCAIFNLKLILHLVTNRGVLPSRRAMSPMEVLIMANGILMIIPVIFAILEWYHFINFESGSLTPTAVAIILPVASLAAQRLSQTNQQQTPNFLSYPSSNGTYQGRYRNTSGSGSRAPLKGGSPFSTDSSHATAAGGTRLPTDGPISPLRDLVDPVDLELRRIDDDLEPEEPHMKVESSMCEVHK